MATLHAFPNSEPIGGAAAEAVDMRFEVVVIPVADVTARRSFMPNWAGASTPTSRSITASGLFSSRRPAQGARFSLARR
jgi:hypothetical protein